MTKFEQLIQEILEEECISESKQVGIVYHYTWLERLINILNTDELIGRNKRISVTRNKHFHKQYRLTVPSQCCFVLDGNKLSERYKIEPYNYYSDFHTNAEPYVHKKYHDEQEEVILTDKIKNLHNYILKIKFIVQPSNNVLSMLDCRDIPYEII